jgi:hypothetical protein
MFFQPLIAPNTRPLVGLPVQYTSVEGTSTYMISMINMTARLDASPGVTNELQIRRGTTLNNDSGTLNVTVFGYLVDIGPK